MTDDRKASTALPEGLVVVAGIDFSQGSTHALREAVRLVQHGLTGSVHAVYVVPESENHARKHPDDNAAELDYGQQRLRQFLAEQDLSAAGAGAPAHIGIHVRIGDPVDELHRVAAQLDADLLVIGPHEGKLFKKRAIGGIAGHVVKGARCPVLVARPKDYSDMQSERIDPPCPRCVQARRESGGARWWCDDHEKQDYQVHFYSAYEETPWAEHDSETVPTGVGGTRM
ncbi:MAG: universal stress protein [Polyangiales bacterium]